MVPNRRRPWGTWTRPLATTISGRRAVIERLENRTKPLKTRTRPESAPRSVDFPAPLAPINATSSPGQSSRSTSNRTGVIPKPAESLLTCSSDGPSGIRRWLMLAISFLAPGVALAQVCLDHTGVVEDLGGWPLHEGLTEVEHEDAVAHAHDDLHDVLDQDDGDAAVPDASDHRQGLLHLDLVEPGHHLVKQQQAGAHRQRSGDFEALAVRHSEPEHGVVPFLGEPDQVEHLVGFPHRGHGLQPTPRPAKERAHRRVLANGHRGKRPHNLEG